MKTKLKPIIGIIIIVLILLMFSIFLIYKNKSEENENKNEIKENQIITELENEIKENQIITELKNEIGVTGNEEIYEVINTDTNTPILNVKENIKFKVALAGMFKNTKPEFEELDKIINENNFYKTGIYIAENSREKFLKLVQKFTQNTYKIDEEGYLECESVENENLNDKKLKEIINLDKLFIISFSDICYTVDDVTGDIIDYPFELMDPYQICKIYKSENKSIVFVTTNSRKKLSDEDIFNELLTL